MATNEAGISLMLNGLKKHVGGAAVMGPSGILTPGFLAPDVCFGNERSRNVHDTQGVENLTRDSGSIGARSPFADRDDFGSHGVAMLRRCYIRARVGKYDKMRLVSREVTVTLGKVPVTPAAGRKIKLQAGMSKRMSHVRGYVPLQSQNRPNTCGPQTSDVGKVRNTSGRPECTKE
jgi:hypothetical protein